MPDPESEAASRLARALYQDASFRTRLQQRYRPYICSFDPLVPEIRSGGGRLLDFGCGAGLFTFHCLLRGYVESADGVDVDAAAIEIANSVSSSLTGTPRIRFHVQEMPPGVYEAISMIDVMHHVPPDKQRATFAALSAKLAPGGVLVYKDIGRRPRWRATANRLHDLVLSRQWIHYAPIEEVIGWAVEGLGLELARRAGFNQYVYGHELAVFRRPIEPITSPAE